MGCSLSLLLVEDDVSLLEELHVFMSDFFADICVANNAEDAYQLFLSRPFDVLISDIRLPEQSGLVLVEKVRKRTPSQIIIMMSAYKEVDYFLKSIELGIYGFLTKPFDSQKLISMMLKLTSDLEQSKRQKNASNHVILYPDVVFDTLSKSLHVKSIPQELTLKEERLLALLVKHRNHFVSNELIAQMVWENDALNNSTLRALVKRLRDKLGYEESICNLKGRGYKLSSMSEAH